MVENNEWIKLDKKKTINPNIKPFEYAERKDITEVNIPNGVTTIGERAFAKCTNLKKLIIPDSVTTIGASAFNECENLEEVVLSKNIKKLNYRTFADCKRLKKIIIPEGIKELDWAVFSGCENIEEIVFASRYGEFARLKTIIEQYSEIGEVSPAQFSGSVHNYLAGFFTLEKKSNIPYYATASAENTLSAGLIKSVLSFRNNILFCYADEYGVACIISKDAGGIKCAMTSGGNDNADEAGSFIDFLEGKTPVFESPLCRIERAE